MEDDPNNELLNTSSFLSKSTESAMWNQSRLGLRRASARFWFHLNVTIIQWTCFWTGLYWLLLCCCSASTVNKLAASLNSLSPMERINPELSKEVSTPTASSMYTCMINMFEKHVIQQQKKKIEIRNRKHVHISYLFRILRVILTIFGSKWKWKSIYWQLKRCLVLKLQGILDITSDV